METIMWLKMHISALVNDGIPDISKYTVLDRAFTFQELCETRLGAKLRSVRP